MIKRVLTILSAFITLYVNGQELNIATCRELALKQNKELAIAEAQNRKAQYAVKQARSNYLPNISANALYLHNNEELEVATPDLPLAQGLAIPAVGLNIGLENSFNAGVNISQPLYTGGKIISSNKMAKIGGEIYSINTEKSREQVIVECDNAYWNCIMAIQLAKVATQYKATLESLLNDITKAQKVGMKSKNDMLKVQVQLNQASLNETKTLNGVKVTKMNLCRIIGIDLNSNITLTEQLTDNSLPNSNPEYRINEIPDMAILNKRIELQEQNVRLTRSDFLPSAAAMVGYGYTNALTLKGTTPFTQTLLPESERMINGTSFSAIATIKIPIFHWGEGHNKVKQAKEDLNIARLQRNHAEDLIKLNIQLAENRMGEAAQLKQMSHTALKQADENLRISENFYKNGMETLSNLLEAQTVWQKAYNDYICSCVEEQLAHLNYLQVTGQL